MINERRTVIERLWDFLKYYAGIYLDGLREIPRNLTFGCRRFVSGISHKQIELTLLHRSLHLRPGYKTSLNFPILSFSYCFLFLLMVALFSLPPFHTPFLYHRSFSVCPPLLWILLSFLSSLCFVPFFYLFCFFILLPLSW